MIRKIIEINEEKCNGCGLCAKACHEGAICMVVGIVISILQAATQIHEQTLTFVPKLIVIGIILVITGNSMLKMLQEFTEQIFRFIAEG